jgi:hypothetical protein
MTMYVAEPGSQVLVEVPDPLQVFRHIATLPPVYDEQPTRYLELQDGNDLFMQVDLVDDRVRGQFAIKRRTQLPPVEAAGIYRPLGLDAEEGLAEIFHFVYYPLTRIFCMEYNHFAPKLRRLSDYLTMKAGHLVTDVQFEAKLAGNVQETLEKVGRMTLMKIGVYSDQVDCLEEWNGDLYRGFQAIKDLDDNARELEVVLRLGSKKRDEELGRTLFRRLGDFLANLNNRQALSSLEVRAHDIRANRTIPIDLLEDKLVAVREVVALDEDSRAVESISMYLAIERAYEELRPSLVQD